MKDSTPSMKLYAIATNGERCSGETHRFRIGLDDREATEFVAGRLQFCERLTDAIIDHGAAKREGKPAAGLLLQVWTTPSAKWRNVQNPVTGGCMAVTHEIAGQKNTCEQLFLWACNSVQMARDLEIMVAGIADAIES